MSISRTTGYHVMQPIPEDDLPPPYPTGGEDPMPGAPTPLGAGVMYSRTFRGNVPYPTVSNPGQTQMPVAPPRRLTLGGFSLATQSYPVTPINYSTMFPPSRVY
jgi:hypothetical protein